MTSARRARRVGLILSLMITGLLCTQAVLSSTASAIPSPGGPTVTSISPNSGPEAGGTLVHLTGSGFSGGGEVLFGSDILIVAVPASDSSMVVSAPSGTAAGCSSYPCTVPVSVATPSGTSIVTTADEYTYAPVPVVTAISPTGGLSGGGTSVTITGTGFVGPATVAFGSSQASGVTVDSATSISATSPAGVGTVDVTVSTPGGTSTTSSADQYTFCSCGGVTSISPTYGPTAGGTPVTITGTNFSGTTAVDFGGTAASSFTVNSSTSISATSPAESAGIVDVTVTTPSGTFASTPADQFTYAGPLTITNPGLSTCTVGIPCTSTLTASGGIGPYTWSVTGGSLLPGLTLDSSTGVITGTIDQGITGGGGQYVEFTVADSVSVTATAYFYQFTHWTSEPVTLTVHPATPNPVALGQDVTYSATVSGPFATPTGVVNFYYSDEDICDAPLTAGTASCTVPEWVVPVGTNQPVGADYTGDGTYGSSLPSTIRLTVLPQPPVIATSSLPNATVGQNYNQRLSTSGGPGPVGWYITGGALPPGLTLGLSTGAISGVPSQPGRFSFTVKISDADGIPDSKQLSIVVNPGLGYDLVGRDGGVFVFPGGQSGGFYGSLPGLGIRVDNVVGIVPASDYRGYFLVGSDGGVFSFGDTHYEGSLPGIGVHVNDIVGIVPSSDDRGYFLVGRDGGVFTFGDAHFEGSLPGQGVHVDDVVSIAATPDNRGYLLLGADGNVYGFGDAPNTGESLGCSPPGSCAALVSIVMTSDGKGYWVTDADGDVYPFPEDDNGNPTGSAGWFGDLGSSNVTDIVSLVPSIDDQGYLLVGADGGTFTFGDFAYKGSLPAVGVHVDDVVGAVPTVIG